MSEPDRTRAIQAVEVGSIFPRAEDSRPIWPYLAGAGGLLLAAAAVFVIFGSPVQFAAVVPVLAALGLAVYPRFGGVSALPQVPGVNLRSFDEIDPECIADHLVGPYGGPTRGLPGGEIVIAEVDDHSAGRLAEVPSECASRWNAESLHTILVAIPRCSDETLSAVTEEYDATLLVRNPADLPAVLGYLPDLVAEPEGGVVTGVGSLTIRQTPIEDRLPGDPGLREDVNDGQGKPLSRVADTFREDDTCPPRATMISAPRDYVMPGVQALEPEARTVVTVQHGDPEIDIVRLWLRDELPEMDAPWRRNSIRADEPEPSPKKPPMKCDSPNEDAPQADRSIDSRC